MPTLMVPHEVDELLRYPRGRALRLARAGKLPHVVLPDGAVRFEARAIAQLLEPAAMLVSEDGEDLASVQFLEAHTSV